MTDTLQNPIVKIKKGINSDNPQFQNTVSPNSNTEEINLECVGNEIADLTSILISTGCVISSKLIFPAVDMSDFIIDQFLYMACEIGKIETKIFNLIGLEENDFVEQQIRNIASFDMKEELDEFIFQDTEIGRKIAEKSFINPITTKPILDNSSSKKLENWFDNFLYPSHYGVNQGGLDELVTNLSTDIRFGLRSINDYINDNQSLGDVLPMFYNDEGIHLINKLVNKGFTEEQACVILSSVDDIGACMYAEKANSIFYQFSQNPSLFEEKFGFPMFTVNDEGKKLLNSNELLLDLYLYFNDISSGGKLFKKKNGKYEFVTGNSLDLFGNPMLDTEQQLSSDYNFSLKKYFNEKGLDWKSDLLIKNKPNNILSDDEFNKLLKIVDKELLDGKSMQLVFSSYGNEVRMLCQTGPYYESTEDWAYGSGHGVFVTGIKDDGFLVSSFGEKYLIPFSDLKNGGNFFMNSEYVCNR